MPVQNPIPAPRKDSLSIRKPDPKVWRQALVIAHGDPRRLDVLHDGTVIVHNKPIR